MMRRQVPTRLAADVDPGVPAVPVVDPSGAPRRPLSQAASATRTRIDHRRILRIALSGSSDPSSPRYDRGNQSTHDRTHHVHEVVPRARDPTNDTRFAPASV